MTNFKKECEACRIKSYCRIKNSDGYLSCEGVWHSYFESEDRNDDTVDNDGGVEFRVCPNCGRQFEVDKYPVSWLEYIDGTKYQFRRYGYYCHGICYCNTPYEEEPVI